MNAEAEAGDSPERDIFFEAVEMASEAERAAYVGQACGGDPALRRRVEVLLADHSVDDGFMQTPVAEIAALDSAAAAPAERPGTVIGRYKLLEPLGEGGFGVVYRAEQQEPVRREVALKIIKLGMDTRQVIARFEAERQALAMMNHPNIAKVLDAGMVGAKPEAHAALLTPDSQLLTSGSGRPYFVMELVRGIPITRFCEEHRLSIQERLELFIPVCQAIQHAHQKGIIHRDIKPSNVLVTRSPDGTGHPMVIDFGVAKAIEHPLTDKSLHTSLLQMIGTPAYMSPEQAERGPGGASDVDTRSDVYSLGTLLYELLTGTPPFPEERLRRAGFAEIQRIIGQEEPQRPSARLARACSSRSQPRFATRRSRLAADLDWIVLKAIDKDRNRRYATSNELAADIRRHLDGEPILARPLSPPARVWRWCRRHTAVAALSAGLVVALGVGFTGTLWQLSLARQNAAENLRQVARLNVLTGVNLLQEGDSFKSLLWFAEALALNVGPPERDAVDRLRIAAIVAQGPQLTAVITHDGQPVAAAAFHPSKNLLATVGRDRRLRIWSIPSGEAVLTTEPFTERPSHILFSPEAEMILVVSSEFNQVQPLSAADGQPLSKPIPHFAGGANNRPLPPRFDATGGHLLTQSQPQTLRVWNTPDGCPLGPEIPVAAPIAWMDFSQDGNEILAITQDGDATAWDWRTGSRISNTEHRTPNVEGSEDFDIGHSVFDIRDSTVAQSPDGSRYATLSADHRIRIWDTETGEPLTPPIDHFAASGPIGFSADGRFLFTMHPAHALYVWELPLDAEPPVLLRPEAPPATSEGRAPRVPNLPSDSGSRPSDLNPASLGTRPSTVPVSSPDGSVIVTRDPGSPIRVRALSGTQEVSLHPASLKEVPLQAWFDDTGQFIILEYPNQHAQIWDAASGLPVTPTFRSRYATNETGYRGIRFPSPISDNKSPDSPFAIRNSLPQALAELLSGSRLDGSGGWRPLSLSEVTQRGHGLSGGADEAGSATLQ